MPGRVLLVTKLKGGAGATTTAREIAVAAASEGLRVGMIDLDSQGGTTRWWNRRSGAAGGPPEGSDPANPTLLQIPAAEVQSRSAALRRAYDLVVIDSPPSVHTTIREVAAASDLAVIPTRPTTDDLDAVGPILRLVRGVTDLGFVITQVPGGGRSRDAAEAHELLAKLAPVFGRLSFRLDYPRAGAAGHAAFETGGTAKEEVNALWRTIAERLEITRSGDAGITVSRDNRTKAGAT